jgi:HEAT repeat protein
VATTFEVLSDLVRRQTTVEGARWLLESCRAVREGRGDVRTLFPAASKRVGRAPLPAGRGDALSVTLGGETHVLQLGAWRLDDGARAMLLLAARDREPARALELAGELYFAGDARERCGVVRALPLLGDGAAAVPVVLDAVRVNQGEIFEAAMCENPYTALHLPEHEFRKAVLRCALLGLPLGRILGLESHADRELCESLLEYAREREAAARNVPPEVWDVVALAAPAGLAAKLLGYLEHPEREHRLHAARALGRAGHAQVRPFLVDRAERERDPAVREAILGALAALPA